MRKFLRLLELPSTCSGDPLFENESGLVNEELVVLAAQGVVFAKCLSVGEKRLQSWLSLLPAASPVLAMPPLVCFASK